MLEKRIYMINIKKYNYFLFDNSKSVTLLNTGIGLKKIVDFLEIENRNQLLITDEYSSMKYMIDNKITIMEMDIDKFNEILKDKSKLFRVDLLIVDLFFIPLEKIKNYLFLLSKLSIDFIILVPKNYENDIIINEDTNIYELYKDNLDNNYKVGGVTWERLDFKNNYFLSDRINNWSKSLDVLKKSYIRDKKINIILSKK